MGAHPILYGHPLFRLGVAILTWKFRHFHGISRFREKRANISEYKITRRDKPRCGNLLFDIFLFQTLSNQIITMCIKRIELSKEPKQSHIIGAAKKIWILRFQFYETICDTINLWAAVFSRLCGPFLVK